MSRWLVLPVLVLSSFVVMGTASSAVRDRDRDRLPDRWEKRYRLSIHKANAKKDPDRDRLRNIREYRLKTNPHKRDTDGDRLGDGAEVRRYRTNPRRRDTDRDGISDRREIRHYKTNPRKKDTDGDGFNDLAEIRAGTNPRKRRSYPRAPALQVPSLPACTHQATTSNFTSQVAAVPTGAVLCMASGDYGSWSGTSKSITIRPADGATPTMSLDFAGAGTGNFTINGGRLAFGQAWGLVIEGGDISGAVHDLTISNSRFTGGLKFLQHPHPRVLLDHNEHVGIPSADTAAIYLPGASEVHSGVTVQNSYFHDFSADGIQTGPAINVIGNEFARLDVGDSSVHSDAIQLYCGCGEAGIGSIVRGNYAHDGEQGIVAFDGSGDHVIEDNVVWNFRVPHGIVLGGDRPGSIVRHNTVGGSGNPRIDCTSKSGFPSSQTAIYDNISQSVLVTGTGGVNCTPSRNDYNMLRGGGSGANFGGIPVFVGGANPTSYAGFRLAPGSPGVGRASDGSNVGIR